MPLDSIGPPLGRTRIVIADDDPPFAEMLRTVLSAHDDFDVIGVAGDGAEAVLLAETLRPDLVVMDLAMPIVDGVEATRRIRDLPDPPSVVLITGEDAEVAEAVYEAGAIAYLRKTHDLSWLVEVIVAFSRLAVAPT
jgi:DNA-binding NarL/FixJ family response regulator